MLAAMIPSIKICKINCGFVMGDGFATVGDACFPTARGAIIPTIKNNMRKRDVGMGGGCGAAGGALFSTVCGANSNIPMI